MCTDQYTKELLSDVAVAAERDGFVLTKLTASRIREAHEFSVVQLKAKLQRRSLPTSGTKNELINRLQVADPTGAWREDDENLRNADDNAQNDESVVNQDDVPEDRASEAHGRRAPASLEEAQRELILLERKKALVARELDLVRREMQLLRASPQTHHSEEVPAEKRASARQDVKALANLLAEFGGSMGTFEIWKRQLNLLKMMYELNDNSTKILIGIS